MPIQTAFTNLDQTTAVADLKRQYGEGSPRAVIFFAAPHYDLAAIGQRINETFPGAVTAGCSTAGELVDDKMLTGSLVAMFLDEDIVETAASATIEQISGKISVIQRVSRFGRATECTGEFARHTQICGTGDCGRVERRRRAADGKAG